MPRYKIIKIYIVEAQNKTAARQKFTTALANNNEEEFLEHISIKEASSNGWVHALRQQLTGSSN
jgi:hypothetical protein